VNAPPPDSPSRIRLLFVSLCVFALLVFILHPLPLYACLPHVRAILGASIPFLLGVPVGLRLVSRREERSQTDIDHLLVGVGIGHGLFFALTLFLLTARLVYIPVLGALAAVLVIVTLRCWESIFRALQPTEKNNVPNRSVLVFLFLAGLLYLACSLLPPTNYDALEYHLPVPQSWLEHHGWASFPHNIYAWFPMNVEILYLWGLAFGGPAATTIINLFYAICSAVAVWLLARQSSSANIGELAAVVFLTSGLVMRLVMQADIDLGVCFYSSLALLAFLRWKENGETKSIILCSIFVGLSLGSKYIAFISVWGPMLLLVLFFGRSGKRIGGLFWMVLLPPLLMSPWLIRNWLMVGNPVFPLLYSWFGGEGWTPAANEFFKAAHSPKPAPLTAHLLALIRSPLDLTLLELTVFSPLILFGGILALMQKRMNGVVRALFCFSGVVFVLWFVFTQRNHRFLVTIAAPLSVLGAVGLNWCGDWLRSPARWPIWAVVYASLFMLVAPLSIRDGLRYLCGTETTEEYYERVLPHTRAIHFLNEQSREHRMRVLFVGEAQAYRCEFDAIVPVVFDPHPWLRHDAEGNAIPLTPEEAAQRLREMGVTHILFNQSELSRLIRGYMPLGWPDGRELARLIQVMEDRYFETAYSTENNVIRVYRIVNSNERA